MALLTATAVALAGVCVLAVTALLWERLVAAREDESLASAASVLAVELNEVGADPQEVALDETRELANTGVVIAVFRQGTRLGGDARLLSVPAGRCQDHANLRACGARAGALIAVAARDRSVREEQRGPMLSAGALAVALTSLLGAIGAFFVAAAVLAPLARLAAAVERVPADAPGAADLGEDEGVAEVDALRASMRETLTRLDHALDHSRRFARDAAHELRTPLASILGELELVREELSAEQRQDIDRAHRRATELAALLERLLILARPHAVEMPADRVVLSEVIDVVVDALPASAAVRITRGGDHLAATRGDRVLLGAMMSNAIDNALKFSEGNVDVSVSSAGECVRISVRDEGPGVEEAMREQVFAPFFRTPSARADGISGQGIGLALIAHVVRDHRGQVRFAPSESGALLEIELPVDSA